MKRKEFIRKACPLIGLSVTSAGFVLACNKEQPPNTIPNEEISLEEEEYRNIKTQMGALNALEVESILYLNLSHTKYEALVTIDGFMNDLDQRILLLRIDDATVLVFDNCCPHRGTRNQWTYTNNTFKCNNHGNKYGVDSWDVVLCSSDRDAGNLLQYNSSLYKDLLKISFE